MPTINHATADGIRAEIEPLAVLIQDAVDGGASVSFLPPLSRDTALAYWRKVADEVERGERIVLFAREHGELAGSVQLALAMPPNGQHRADLQKLLVFSRFRRRGIGEALMRAAEAAARECGRSLIVLDTLEGSDAERLYPRLGYTRLGVIPNFALYNGGLSGTVVFYRVLET